MLREVVAGFMSKGFPLARPRPPFARPVADEVQLKAGIDPSVEGDTLQGAGQGSEHRFARGAEREMGRGRMVDQSFAVW